MINVMQRRMGLRPTVSTRADTAARERRGDGADTVGEGKHLRFRVRQQGRDGGSAIGFGLGAQLDRLVEAGRLDVAFRLKENRWNGTIARSSSSGACSRPRPPTTSCAPGSRASGARADAWTPEAGRIFAELGLTPGGARRQLLESASFRALLERGGADLPLAACRRQTSPS